MISCTDFIPAYSEFFVFLEDRYGPEEVSRCWDTLFKPDGKGGPLITFVEKEGIRGCFSYWSGTLNEEAADFTMYLSEKRGFFLLCMHKCPSKGKLLQMQEKIGLVPYRDYCLHCDGYRAAIEKVGLTYTYNFQGVEKAACSLLITDPKRFDGRVIIDEDTKIMERRASENEYFHPSFHHSLSRCIHYIATEHGDTALREYLGDYVRKVLLPLHPGLKTNSLAVIAELIKETYRKEKAQDAVSLVQTEDALEVTVRYCPGVKYMQTAGKWISPYFSATTRYVMEALARHSGLQFSMDAYEESTGAAAYRFCK